MTAPKDWQKPSRSGPAANCVEIGQAPGLVGIRDTKNRDGGTLLINHTTFGTFLQAIRDDRLR
ncbi:hypothetical protein FHR81_000803 [Actinoalloteichus hoggarensis]|uniref:Uncharacterized protein n=1 Tax=Actinoalloteichus hoggarensis TaxID=1470176 RepID=A0A221W168_9PSEU|nr:DUF397 domain-containing protein [Actinoalloteichus hoggarensis]ASO19519.1 hypothetical protein AHOG_09375 [Actinoalloteichus hoggarensis]MBB5919774.1 hypothetical protein [Actinoalloteichus hoggarensis]